MFVCGVGCIGRTFLRLFVVRVYGDCLVVLVVLVVSVTFGCVVRTAGCVLVTDWR